MKQKLMIIDGFSLANRAFFALPPLENRKGQPTNAVYGLLMMLLKLLEKAKPDYLVTAFDVAAPTFRHLEYQQYKGHRMKMEDSLKSQLPIIREMMTILKIPIYEKAGFEADDVIGTFAKKAVRQGLEVEIITGDRDSFQLVEPGIKVLYTKKGISEYDTVTEATIQERYQLTPQQLIDLKGLMGDSSDNIPGVPGVGEKTALKYLHQYGSLEAVLEHVGEISRKRDQELLTTYREQAILSKRLATIDTRMDLELPLDQCCHHQEYSREELREFCREYEFKTLLAKLSGDEPVAEIKKLPEVEFAIEVANLEQLAELRRIVTQAGACEIQFLAANANWRRGQWLGLGLGCGEENWFYRLTPQTELPADLAAILEDSRILKRGHDLKKQMILASQYGVKVEGPLDDLMLVGYLVNSGVNGLELEDLAVTYLQQTLPVWQNDRGTKKGIYDLPETLAQEELTRLVGSRLAGIKRLADKLKAMLGEMELQSLYTEVELPLLRVLFEMEQTGIKMEPEILRAFGKELRERQEVLESDIYQLTGAEFNIGSPKQLGSVLFEKLGLTPPKKNKTGYSTDAAVLESLISAHPVIAKILEYRQNVKLQSTYIESLIDLIHPKSGRVHTTFNQAVTSTGRLSSTEPNLQNIPIRTEEGRKIRQAFIPGASDLVLFSADYSQIELRVMAHFSQDAAYREAFLKGEDIHQFTAAAVWGVPLEQVTKTMRSQAKAVNFGIIYGISGFGLAQNIGVTRKEAEAFIKAYFSKYPGVEAYSESLIAQAQRTGEAKTLLGRIRRLPDLTSRNFTLRSFAERTARNTPLQGTAADIIKVAMVKIQAELKNRPELGKLLLQVHDELVFETRQSSWRELAGLVKYEMENAVTLNVPLVVDLKMGSNWGTMQPVELEG